MLKLESERLILIATDIEMAEAEFFRTVLTSWAFSNPSVNKVVAQTYPELIPSQKVLSKCGFKYVGDGYEERTTLFEILKQSNQF